MSSKESTPKEALSKEYVKCYTVVEEGKTIEVFYNPNEKDSLKAYIKKVIN